MRYDILYNGYLVIDCMVAIKVSAWGSFKVLGPQKLFERKDIRNARKAVVKNNMLSVICTPTILYLYFNHNF